MYSFEQFFLSGIIYCIKTSVLFFQGKGCSRPKKFYKYRVHEYADIEGDTVKEQEERMMAEIYQRGPIACGISVTDELYKHYKGGVFFDKTNATQIDHDISVVGYGVDKPTGLKYWLIRNSWGTYWVRYFVSFRSIIS